MKRLSFRRRRRTHYRAFLSRADVRSQSEDVASFGDLPDGVAICINTDPHAPLCHHESMKSTSSLADVSGPALHRGNGSAEQPRKTDR